MSKILATVSKIGAATAVSLLLGLAVNKLVANFYGPTGIGLFSLIKQAILALSFYAVGAQAVVIQGVASRKKEERNRYFDVTFIAHLLAGLMSVIALWSAFEYVSIFRSSISNNYYALPIPLVCLASVFASLYFLVKSTLNGVGATNKLLVVDIFGPVILIAALVASLKFENSNLSLWISLALFLSYSSMFAMGIFFLRQYIKIQIPSIRELLFSVKESGRSFVGRSTLSVGAALIGGVSLLLVRLNITSSLGLEAAGYFDAAWTLSNTYLAILVGAFGVYYLPTLSAVESHERRVEIVRKIFKLSVITCSILICFLIANQKIIIPILYADEFLPAYKMVRWMLVGDYFKMGAWVLAIVSISRGNMLTFLLTELSSWLLLLTATYLTTGHDENLEFVSIVYAVMYILLFIFYVNEVKIRNKISLSRAEWMHWIAGILFIAFYTVTFWKEESMRLTPIVAGLLILPGLHYLLLPIHERVAFKRFFLRKPW
jgi:PST family polysaccharide transporter